MVTHLFPGTRHGVGTTQSKPGARLVQVGEHEAGLHTAPASATRDDCNINGSNRCGQRDNHVCGNNELNTS